MPLARKYRLGDRPVVVWVFPDPAPFLLPSGVALNGLTILNPAIQFSAISPNQPGMNYTVISGAPPFGTTFSNGFGANADFAFLSGTVQGGPSPIWISPPDGSLLATLGELEDITPLNISLNAGPQPPASSIGYYVFRGALPPGILLDYNTGDLSGVVASLVGAFPPDFNVNPPTWNSPADGALLGSFGEREAVNLSGWPNLTYFGTPTETYFYVIEGGLPSGLFMDYNTGTITGSVAEAGGNPAPVAPTISAFNSTGTVGSAFSGTVTFAPAAGQTLLGVQVLSGRLPDGLILDYSTGVFSGTPTVGGTFDFTLRAHGSTPDGFADAVSQIVVS